MSILDAIDELIVVYKHLQGKHDQRTHAPHKSGMSTETDVLGLLAENNEDFARGLRTQIEAAEEFAETAGERQARLDKLREETAAFQESEEYTHQEGDWY